MEEDTQRADFMESSRNRINEITESSSLDLRYIKALLLQKQYRRCITACRDMLKLNEVEEGMDPIRQSFVRFYLALAHDELARAMHNYSQAKISAFNQAEDFYRDALLSLPTHEQLVESLTESATSTASGDHNDDEEPTPRLPSSTCFGSTSAMHAFTGMHSSVTSTHIRNNSIPTPSPPLISPRTVTSDLDDLESHDSFNQIMTPNRVPKLERDYSSMSLIHTQQQQMSQGLMRPIRIGSPPTKYHVPPKLPYSGAGHQQSKLPRLDTACWSGSPVRKQLRSPSEQVSPIDSPVSPLGSDWDAHDGASDDATISPVSPNTPLVDENIGQSDEADPMQRSVSVVEAHFSGVHSQLESHIKLAHEEKERILRIQAERAAARKDPTLGGGLTAFLDATSAKDKRIQQTHSYWSFTPEDVKVLEKQRRIVAGRKRGWMRARFDPTRYQELADKAVAEL